MDIGKHKKEFHYNGYTIIKEAYSNQEVEELKREYEKVWLEKVASGEIKQDPTKPLNSLYPRQRDTHLENKEILKFALKESVLNVLEMFIDEEVELISTNFYYKPPTMEGIPFHQDNYGIGVSPGTCHAIWTCLEKTDENNGGMRFVPESHKLELLTPKKVYNDEADTFGGYIQTLEVPDGYDIISVNTEPGDVVIYHGHAIHDSTKNKSASDFRNSIICHYCGTSSKKLTLNYNKIINKKGERIRKRVNMSSFK
ncbi:phytanoyl-CoA dioxygenase family protein [Oceanobacillus profundus]|uniref:phytanoyl-CoA dioxygenase family protein n=1 Tax=Oceanobacillus TaxID=182709 RepID=UPI000BA7CD94|nr:phytanoyl-CoA dioxygenase family protein [Oceanobacillus profundus]MCM3399747.1 phytanoyl-CoA dioxygenase family protein [Oceanobacillus profundus]MDO6450001.1 phytanoyl-CoA dioxygenase family protein [Oceanobacillus profundus]PAE28215.1 phytanoyl-CoA dioxygenase [Paenibacillus sp. 7884-2]